MELNNKQLKDIALRTLSVTSNVERVEVTDVWENNKEHVRQIVVWEESASITGELIANIEVRDNYSADQVKYLLLAEVDYLEEYFIDQNK